MNELRFLNYFFHTVLMLTAFETIHLINDINQFSTNVSTIGKHQLLFIDLLGYNAVSLNSNSLENWNLYSWEKIKIIIIAYYLKFFFSMYT